MLTVFVGQSISLFAIFIGTLHHSDFILLFFILLLYLFGSLFSGTFTHLTSLDKAYVIELADITPPLLQATSSFYLI